MKPQSVAEYISQAPPEIQDKLKILRSLIKEVAPEAEEKLSYGMPYYGLKGRLAYFGYAKDHIGLYIPPPVIQNHQKDLRGYQTAVATVQLPFNQDLPISLIKKLVLARVAINKSKK